MSPGCDHCYAASWAKRSGRNFSLRIRTTAENWREPLRWNAQPFVECRSCGWRGELRRFVQRDAHGTEWTMCPACNGHDYLPARARVFCASLADVFDNAVDPAWRVDLLTLIANTPNLDWLLLTKRIGNAHAMLDDALADLSCGLTRWADTPWPNVWLGATVCNQEEADRDIPKLLEIPARVKFLSIEPMLGAMDIGDFLTSGAPCCRTGFVQGSQMETGYCETCGGHVGDSIHDPARHDSLDWVIVGGESGLRARPMHPRWVRDIREQCAVAGVPFLFKQWGEWIAGENDDAPGDFRARYGRVPERWPTDMCGVHTLFKVGKKAAGRVLDGRTHDGFPRGMV